MSEGDIANLARKTIETARSKDVMIAVAESCTGGLVAAALTDVAGSSVAFDRGFVTYSNDAKVQMLGVPVAALEAQGAVSDVVARAMAAGALENSRASVTVAITGIAGPGGGSDEKPVGLVHIAAQTRDALALSREFRFRESHGTQTRADIRRVATQMALTMLLVQLDALPSDVA